MITAVVLAAGLSRRMGRPKMILPWRGTTVIGRVVSTLAEGGLEQIVVVTGGARQEVESALEAAGVRSSLQVVFNPNYARGEMIESLVCGLRLLGEQVEAAMIVLGDQPQIEAGVVAALVQAYAQKPERIIIPSYRMRRGHPWLLQRALWPELTRPDSAGTMREFLNAHSDEIGYLLVDTPSVLQDLDTPEDYRKHAGQALEEDQG